MLSESFAGGNHRQLFLKWKFLFCDPAVQGGKPVCVSAESQPELSCEGRCSGHAPTAAQQNFQGLVHAGLKFKKQLSPGFGFGSEIGSCCQVSALDTGVEAPSLTQRSHRWFQPSLLIVS